MITRLKKKFSLFEKITIYSCVALSLIVSLAPYQGDSTLGSDSFRSIVRIISYLLFVLLLLSLIFVRPNLNFGILVPIIFWAFTTFNVYSKGLIQLSLLNILILMCIMIIPKRLCEPIVKSFRKCMIVICLLGIFFYLSYIFHIGIPYKVVNYYFELKDGQRQYYISYGLSYIYLNSNEARLCGLFNEPGYLGTICALLICLDKIRLKNIGNWVLFVAGCLTFSLAFFIIIGFYIILISIKKKSVLIIVLSLALFYLFVLPNIKFNSFELNNLVQRITISNGKLLGDDRSNPLFDSTFASFLKGPKVLFGYGGGYSSRIAPDVSTFKTFILDYGIIAFILTYGSLLLFCVFTFGKNWLCLSYIIVFFLSIYQRPGIFIATYFVILICGGYHISSENHKETRKKTTCGFLKDYKNESTALYS